MLREIVLNLIVWLLSFNGPELAIDYPVEEYNFYVAGHAYGSHRGLNLGLHPTFLKKLNKFQAENHPAFGVYAGDFIRKPSMRSWLQTAWQIRGLGHPVFLVMGNHDKSKFGDKIFKRTYGETFYYFKHGSDLFIVLDGHIERGQITNDQIAFVKRTLMENASARNIFVIFHELLWTAGQSKYEKVRHNYDNYQFASNFWQTLPPLFEGRKETVFFIAGDLGGQTFADAVFYEKVSSNITLVATGMGQVPKSNFLKIRVQKQGQVNFDVVPLRDNVDVGKIEDYSF